MPSGATYREALDVEEIQILLELAAFLFPISPPTRTGAADHGGTRECLTGEVSSAAESPKRILLLAAAQPKRNDPAGRQAESCEEVWEREGKAHLPSWPPRPGCRTPGS